MAASILDLLNTHSFTLSSKDCFKQHIEHLICEIIQKISCSSHDCLTLSKNLDCILPEKSMHFIKHCVIRQLSVKQEVSSWDLTTPAKEYFDRDDRRALARLSLLGSAGGMVDEIRLITNEKFVSRQVLNYLSKAHTLPYPQLFFARSISPQDCSIHSGIFQAYKGYADSALRMKSAEFNALFQRTIKLTEEPHKSIEEAIRLSFEISQREFSEVYDLPRLINQDVDSLSEFLGYNEMLKGILIRCVEGVDHPTKISIFKELTPYITSVLQQINKVVNEMSRIPRVENANLLKLVMTCNVMQSIIAIKLKLYS
jgi:hypothetical protein